jgi:CheY-like chemotaxis protein
MSCYLVPRLARKFDPCYTDRGSNKQSLCEVAVTGERILVVDDTDDIRDIVINNILKPYAFDYIEAGDGLEALEEIKANAPDLVLCDLQMPRMDGIGLLHKLREEKIRIPVVLMTSYGSEEIAVEVFRLGVRDYVIKPFTEEDLLSAIESALAETRLRNERDQLTENLATLNVDLKTHVQQLEALYRAGREIVSTSNPDVLMMRVLESIEQFVPVEDASLLLLDADGKTLVTRAVRSKDGVQLTKRTSDDKLAREAVETNEPRVGDPQIDGSFEHFKVPVCVPMQVGKTTSVLSATLSTDAVSDRLLNLLNTLAVYAAVSLERVRLNALLGEEKKSPPTKK